ncbi:MAG: hypothetical protein LBL65_00555 [Campylobacteraceae bacterium]|jgi:hypothetical protein|nr:hypothetical protein [Campylobacteraceae bacterium]
MTTISEQRVLELSQYFTILHHTKGRIRLAINPNIKKILKEYKTLSIDKAKEFIKKIDGIKEFKFIALLGTVTIIYDSDILNAQLIEDFINGKNMKQITEFINTFIFNITGG